VSLILAGRHITWFLPRPWTWKDPDGYQWVDKGAMDRNEGPYASGLPLDTLGIALPNHHGTLRGWWKLDFPQLAIIATIRQVDVGPDTGVVDLCAPLAHALFKRPERLPDHTPWQATYLGMKLPDGAKEGIVRE
jgi:hypothetical protein